MAKPAMQSSIQAKVRLAGNGPDSRDLQHWGLPVEVPVALRLNAEEIAVMMATPQDLEQFAIGFVLTEELIGRTEDLQKLRVEQHPAGQVIEMQVREKTLVRQALRRRRFEGRSGCGICGVESLEKAVRVPPPVERRFMFSPEAVSHAFESLPKYQPINRCNRSVHAAAWCRPNGKILLAREDVGRHNALDKLIGTLAQRGQDFREGFVLLSSRCSFELVQKAAVVGIPALASISAPTSLALELACQAGMTLAARCADSVALFEPLEDHRTD
jgi:FdhD protein